MISISADRERSTDPRGLSGRSRTLALKELTYSGLATTNRRGPSFGAPRRQGSMTDCVYRRGRLYWQSITLALRMGDWGAVATAGLGLRRGGGHLNRSFWSVMLLPPEPGRRLGPARSSRRRRASRHRYHPRRHWHAVRGYRLHRVVGLISPPVGDPARVVGFVNSGEAIRRAGSGYTKFSGRGA